MLELPPEEMRRLGYRAIDRLVEHVEVLRDLPPIRLPGPGDLVFAGAPCPDDPSDPAEALDALFDEVLAFGMQATHPRMFARIGSPSTYLGALAQLASTGVNAFSASWLGGSGATAVELTVLDWMRGWLGLPTGAEGILVSGGSLGNLTALAVAAADRRPDRARATAYVSDQTHATVERAWRVLGFDPAHLRVLRADERQRLTPPAVRTALTADRELGLEPFLLVATAGTTSTGAVDALPELADLAAAETVWLHVDGAYGAFAVLAETGRRALEGIDRADSVTLDPHKWLFQPYEVGAVLVRRPGLLESAFSLDGPYLRDHQDGDVQLRNRGLELSRSARGVRIWLSLRVFGLAAFREAVARGIALAEHAESFLRARPGWEVVSPAQLGIVCFRPEEGDVDEIVARAVGDGFAAPSSTVVGDRVALRLCTINPRTTFDEIEQTIVRFEELR